MSEEKEKKAKTSVKDVSVVHKGTQIILPEINGKPMTYEEAIEWLRRKKKEDEEITSVHYEFQCSPLDGLVAFHKALAIIYGWTQMVPTSGFFGPMPPTMLSVPVSATETLQVAHGRVEIPGVRGYLKTNIVSNPEPRFIITGEILQKHKPEVQHIEKEIKKILKSESIYKGKAIKVSWEYLHEDKDGDHRPYHPIQDAPQFMELSGVNDDDLIFGEKVINALSVGLFTPIEHSQACRDNLIPLKRGVLLYGPYGTGKTMTAYVAAKKAERHGWTFMYLDNVTDLKRALDFASKYSPCVLFAEDIDHMMSGDRNDEINEILNTLDGVDTKGAEIITVFTTNHIEKINPATLRMGRLDSLINVTPPDAKAAERLVSLYSRGLLEKDADLESVGKKLAGEIPAFIREVTERAKIAAIGRTASSQIKGTVMASDLLTAADEMEAHASMLKERDAEVDMTGFDVVIPANKLKAFSPMVSSNGHK